MFLIALLVNLAFQAAIAIIIAGSVLQFVGQTFYLPWRSHPVVRVLIHLANGMCAPFRLLLKRMGIPTRPLDFSPVVAVFVLSILRNVVRWFLR